MKYVQNSFNIGYLKSRKKKESRECKENELNILREAWALPGRDTPAHQLRLARTSAGWFPRAAHGRCHQGPPVLSTPSASPCFSPHRTGCSRALTWSHLGCRDNKKTCLQPKDRFALLGPPSMKERWGRREIRLEPQEGSGRQWGRGASSPAFPLRGSDCRLRGQFLPAWTVQEVQPRSAQSQSSEISPGNSAHIFQQ